MDLSEESKTIIKATAPVLKEHGLAITQTFYKNLFDNHPYIHNFFNKSHIFPKNGEVSQQARALANAVFAYATYIDDLGQLTDAVQVIAHRHVSFQIPKESYQDVGLELLNAIKEVLGDAATDDILNAWKQGYFFLAKILQDVESNIQSEQLETMKSWNGFEALELAKKIPETENITSFYFKRANGKPVGSFKAGQYLSLRLRLGNETNLRNYSLSCGTNAQQLRISVKKEQGSTPGLVSSHLHDNLEVGDTIEVGAPCGTFVLKSSNLPIVLIGGGVGFTPMLSMLETLAEDKDSRSVTYIHCVKTPKEHAFAAHVDKLVQEFNHFTSHVYYSQPFEETEFQLTKTEVHKGRIDKGFLDDLVDKPENCAFYICGPKPFINETLSILASGNVPSNQISYEYFGPQLQ